MQMVPLFNIYYSTDFTAFVFISFPTRLMKLRFYHVNTISVRKTLVVMDEVDLT